MKILTGIKKNYATELTAGTSSVSFNFNLGYLYPDYSLKVYFANPSTTDSATVSVGLVWQGMVFNFNNSIAVAPQDAVSIFLPRNAQGIVVTTSRNLKLFVSCLGYDISHYLEDNEIAGKWYSDYISANKTWSVPNQLAPGVPMYILNPNSSIINLEFETRGVVYELQINANEIKVWGVPSFTWPSLGYDLSAFESITGDKDFYILYSLLG